jgi:hypothetical protein
VSAGLSLKGLLRITLDYVRRIESVEPSVKIDPTTGLPSGMSGKITLREPTAAALKLGFVSVETLYGIANEVLSDEDRQLWILLDRLDVAFAETEELEKNALRALFRVYLDLAAFSRIGLKIFLRTDIWRRLTEEGFREASHITRHVYLTWDAPSLLNLVVRRALRNSVLRDYYHADEQQILGEAGQQRQLFYRIFPKQVDAGSRRPETLDWMLSRIEDGSREVAPRELIHFLLSAQGMQLKQLERGEPEPPDEALFDRTALRSALPEVSKVRLEQTLYAEHPKLRPRLEELVGEKTEQTPVTLAKIWKVKPEEALALANELVRVGFFEPAGSKDQPAFWVPFLYRDALDMIQGAAE